MSIVSPVGFEKFRTKTRVISTELGGTVERIKLLDVVFVMTWVFLPSLASICRRHVKCRHARVKMVGARPSASTLLLFKDIFSY